MGLQHMRDVEYGAVFSGVQMGLGDALIRILDWHAVAGKVHHFAALFNVEIIETCPQRRIGVTSYWLKYTAGFDICA